MQNYTGLECKDRFFDGACGEMALKKYFDSVSVRYEHTSNDMGVSDEQDFIGYISGKPVSINIKHSNHPAARYLLFNETQARYKTEDYLIGSSGKLDGPILLVSVWGIISTKRFLEMAERVVYKTAVLRFPLRDLFPIENAIQYFEVDKNRIRIDHPRTDK